MANPAAPQLLGVAEAIVVIDAVAVSSRPVEIAFEEAIGLRLARDLAADRDYPPFDKSMMDGYAVRSADVAGGQAQLRVIGQVAAGRCPERAIEPGQAMAIMTGAPMPAGADGVVPVEDVEAKPPVGGLVRVVRAIDPRRHVSLRGSDCPAASVVLRQGAVIGPAQIAVLASIGVVAVPCYARPTVSVLGTGDELAPAGQTPGPSQIRDSNTPMLAALLRRLGCDVAQSSRVRDDPDAIRAAILRGLRHDALFIAGGMSMGEYDYVPRILEQLGVDIRISKLRIKPGKPFIFGIGKAPESDRPCYIFGLPGNPVSAYVCTVRLASRLLARLAGGVAQERWTTARLGADLPANGPREFYVPALCQAPPPHHSGDDSSATVVPLPWKGSADVFAFARANALIIRAENAPAVASGQSVQVLEI